MTLTRGRKMNLRGQEIITGAGKQNAKLYTKCVFFGLFSNLVFQKDKIKRTLFESFFKARNGKWLVPISQMYTFWFAQSSVIVN